MIDVVDPKTRSRMMAGIRSKNTSGELLLRKQLHKLGFRFRVHCKELPGRPDILFPRYRAVIFVNGCFWHRHDCSLFRWPSSRASFWRDKLAANAARDEQVLAKLRAEGWRIGIIWECALKGRHRHSHADLVARCAEWLRSEEQELQIAEVK